MKIDNVLKEYHEHEYLVDRGKYIKEYKPINKLYELKKNAYYIKLNNTDLLRDNYYHVLNEKEIKSLWKYDPIKYKYLGKNLNKEEDDVIYKFENEDGFIIQYSTIELLDELVKYPYFIVSDNWKNNHPDYVKLKKNFNSSIINNKYIPISDSGYFSAKDLASFMMAKSKPNSKKGGNKKKTTKRQQIRRNRSTSKNKK
jgi:hypothetical protein